MAGEKIDVDEQLNPQAKAWLASLNTTCNRLSTQYLSLLRSACKKADGSNRSGGTMVSEDEPPPVLAADAAITHLQAQLAAQNICVACSQLVDLIRTLRLSALLMDHGAIREEELIEIDDAKRKTAEAVFESYQLEAQLQKNTS